MENLLGDYIKKQRGSMSLRAFAEKVGISHTYLSSLEKGYDPRTGQRRSVTTDTLSTLANALGVDYQMLACLADNVDPGDLVGDAKKESPASPAEPNKAELMQIIQGLTPDEAQKMLTMAKVMFGEK